MNMGRNPSLKKRVRIYTDGACSGNPGPGGWACILKYGAACKELRGYAAQSTNQRMELQAALEGLRALKEPCEVELYSDSAYLVNGFRQGWLDRWEKNGWLNAKKEPVDNQDLWRGLLEMSKKHDISWYKVKGHAGHAENERCDELARLAIKENQA